MFGLSGKELKTYKHLRAIGVPLMSQVVATLPAELIGAAARDLGMLNGSSREIQLDQEDDVNFIMDRAIHDIAWPPQEKERWIERVCDGRVAIFTKEEHVFFEAHREATFSLYEIRAIDVGFGGLIADVFSGKEIALYDIGLSVSATVGTVLATRVIDCGGIHFTSGVSCPFPSTEREYVIDRIRAFLFDVTPAQMFADRLRAAVPTIFKLWKERGIPVEEQMNVALYANAQKKSSESLGFLMAASERVGRNEPCPCGSGKKYKKCHMMQEGVSERNGQRPVIAERCYINPDWRETGLARIMIVRHRHSGSMLASVFLVDVWCLGVKDAFQNEVYSLEELDEEQIQRTYFDGAPIPCLIEDAGHIVHGAVAYARTLGFEPHPDFFSVRDALPEESDTPPRSMFGRARGRPCYVVGPYDDRAYIIATLEARFGKSGFDVIAPEDFK